MHNTSNMERIENFCLIWKDSSNILCSTLVVSVWWVTNPLPGLCELKLLLIQNSVNWSELGQILVLDYVECIENFCLNISEKVYSVFCGPHLLFQCDESPTPFLLVGVSWSNSGAGLCRMHQKLLSYNARKGSVKRLWSQFVVSGKTK